jgi:hypothetical protein
MEPDWVPRVLRHIISNLENQAVTALFIEQGKPAGGKAVPPGAGMNPATNRAAASQVADGRFQCEFKDQFQQMESVFRNQVPERSFLQPTGAKQIVREPIATQNNGKPKPILRSCAFLALRETRRGRRYRSRRSRNGDRGRVAGAP